MYVYIYIHVYTHTYIHELGLWDCVCVNTLNNTYKPELKKKKKNEREAEAAFSHIQCRKNTKSRDQASIINKINKKEKDQYININIRDHSSCATKSATPPRPSHHRLAITVFIAVMFSPATATARLAPGFSALCGKFWTAPRGRSWSTSSRW